MARDALSYKAVKDLVPHHINVNEYIDIALMAIKLVKENTIVTIKHRNKIIFFIFSSPTYYV